MCEPCEVCCCEKSKARVMHSCYECHGIISKGEQYIRYHGIFDHDPFTFKVCQQCEALREQINRGIRESEDMVYFGGLLEFVFERRDINEMRAFLENCEQRHGTIHPWMRERFDDEFNKADDKAEQTA